MLRYHYVKNLLLNNNNNRIYGLDIMRATAILLVLVSHSRHYLKPLLGDIAEYLNFGGYLGVELFFVLSGFLIGGILLKLFNKKGKEITLKDIQAFWIRRWFRTLPNYYLVFFINVLFLSITTGRFVFDYKYLIFIQNLFTPILGDMNYAQSWSLTIEEWFYLITPLLFLLAIRLSKFNIKSIILTVIILLLCVFPIWKYFYYLIVDMIFKKGDKITFDVYRSVTFLRLDSLLYGVFMAYLNYYYKEFLQKKSKILFLTGVSSLIVIILISITNFHNNVERSTSLLFNILFPSLGSLGLSFLLPLLNNFQECPKNFFSKFVTFTSIISYSLYLLHFSVVYPIINSLHFNPVMSFLFFWLLSYFISALNYILFEIRMTKLREKF